MWAALSKKRTCDDLQIQILCNNIHLILGWRDVAKELKSVNNQSFDDLLVKVRTFREMTSSAIQLNVPFSRGQSIKKKASIKQLFTATSKFQKHLKR